MRLNKSLDQQIAVFGESGSGKTVLLSSLYGATQEPAFLKSSLFNVVAEDIGQGNRLFQNYLRAAVEKLVRPSPDLRNHLGFKHAAWRK